MLETIKLRERNQMLYIHYRANGRLIRKSLKLKATKPNIAFAQKHIIPELYLKLIKGKDPFSTNKVSVFFDKVLERCENKAASTRYIYQKSAEYFLEYFGDVDISSITVLDIDRYIEHLINNKKLSNASVKLYLTAVSLMFNEAIRLDVIQKNPVTYAIKPASENKERKAYTITQMWQMLNKADEELKTFLYLGFFTGMRAGEILALTWQDIDFSKREIFVTKSVNREGVGKTKSKKNRAIPLLQILYDYLLEIRRTDGRLINVSYQTIRTKMQALCESLGFFYQGTHNIRHTFASIMLQAKENPALVARFLGHEDLTMINKVYAHYLKDKQDCVGFMNAVTQKDISLIA